MDASIVIFCIFIIVLIIYIARLQGQISAQAQKQLKIWQDKEIDSIRIEQASLARKEANIVLERWKLDYERSIRQDAIDKSRHVTLGKVTEQLVPFLRHFHYNPKNARFIGSPIDFIVFDGLDEGEVKQVVFIEVKTGSSSMNKREKQVRDVIEAKKVRWEELRIDFNQSSYKKGNNTRDYDFANDKPLRPYNKTESYEVDERISHKEFGSGRVISVNETRLKVHFEHGVKVLELEPKKFKPN